MAVEIIVDTLTDLSADEEYGVVTRLVRSVLIVGLDETATGSGKHDYRALFLALDSIGLENGSTPTDLADEYYGNLRLTRRNVSMLPGSNTQAQATLTYEHFLNAGQPINQDNNWVYIRSRSSLSQVTTNKYPDDYADESLAGKPITVKHTYADGTGSFSDEDGNTIPKHATRPGTEDVQGGEISVMEPQETITAEGLFSTDYPSDIRNAVIGHVNDALWMGGEAGTWLCTVADWEDFDVYSSPARVKFNFEWQYKKGGWQPTAVYTDPDTGKPPAGLVDGEGIKTIDYYPGCNFADEVGPLIDMRD